MEMELKETELEMNKRNCNELEQELELIEWYWPQPLVDQTNRKQWRHLVAHLTTSCSEITYFCCWWICGLVFEARPLRLIFFIVSDLTTLAIVHKLHHRWTVAVQKLDIGSNLSKWRRCRLSLFDRRNLTRLMTLLVLTPLHVYLSWCYYIALATWLCYVLLHNILW